MHSTSSATSDISEQLETCYGQIGLSWTRGRRAGKSVNFDRKPDPNSTGLWSSQQQRHSHSSPGHNNPPNMEDFPDWLEDNWSFSRQTEVPIRKKSLWDWRRLRALAHIGQQPFSCIFSMQVHRIEELPQSMNGSLVSVRWRKGNREVQTKPTTVSQGIVEFEETLHQNYTIYGSKKPDQGMHYRSKFVTLFVTAVDAEDLDFGKHRLDLSTMLPEILADGRENAEPRTWSTSFKLAGKAIGGTLYVTFRYRILNKEIWQIQPINTSYVDFRERLSKLSWAPSICASEGHASPSISEPGETSNYISDFSLENPLNKSPKTSLQLKQSENMKGSSLASLFALEVKNGSFPPASHLTQYSGISREAACQNEDEVVGLEDLEDDIEFTVVEKGVEMSCINLSELMDCNKSCGVNSLKSREEEGRTETGTSLSELRLSDSLYPWLEKNGDVQVSQMSHEHKQEMHSDLGKASNRNDDDLVESEFLSMLIQDHDLFCLGSVSEADSTRAHLCHQFERVSFSEASGIRTGLYVPAVSSFTRASRHSCHSDEDLNLVSLVQAAGSELEKETTQTMCRKIRARSLDDAEAEALVQKWGLEEKAFQNSPPDPSGGFGSPINSPVPGPVHLPALATRLGMDDGGLQRSVSPGRLIMHDSKP